MLWPLSTPPTSVTTMNQQVHSSHPAVYSRPAHHSISFFTAASPGTVVFPGLDQPRQFGSLCSFHCELFHAMRTSCAVHMSVNWMMLPLSTGCGFHHSCCTLAFYLGGTSKDGQEFPYVHVCRYSLPSSFTATFPLLPLCMGAQVNLQAEEQNKYGKGVEKLLIQLDKSVPDFAASL